MSEKRCEWVTDDPVYLDYHDHEWGIPVHDERQLFEMLSLEGAQAGLSWLTILKRRKSYKQAFDNFEPQIIQAYDEVKIASLLQDAGIIRNQLKIRSVITNAKAFLSVQQEFGTFDTYIWQFVGGEPILNNWKRHDSVPVQTEISERMSKDLLQRGFKFIGPVICYAFMGAVGMVNDHTKDCFLYHERMK